MTAVTAIPATMIQSTLVIAGRRNEDIAPRELWLPIRRVYGRSPADHADPRT